MAPKMECHGFYAWQGNWSRLFGAAFPETAPGAGVAPLLTRVPVVWFSFDERGDLVTTGPYAHRPADWGRVVAECRRRDLAVDMTVAHLDGPVLESLLTSEKVMDRIVRGIAREAGPFDGVNIDLEGLGPKSKYGKTARHHIRQLFNRFLHKLTAALAPRDKKLYVCLHPLNSWYLGYDYPEIGRLADGLIIMAYHYGPAPEPAPLVDQSLTMALKEGVPPDRLLLGILALRPYETPETMGEKIRLARQRGVGGIALWKISFLDADYRAVLQKHLGPG